MVACLLLPFMMAAMLIRHFTQFSLLQRTIFIIGFLLSIIYVTAAFLPLRVIGEIPLESSADCEFRIQRRADGDLIIRMGAGEIGFVE